MKLAPVAERLAVELSLLGLCIGQIFSIRYDTIHLDAISDILDEQFIESCQV